MPYHLPESGPKMPRPELHKIGTALYAVIKEMYKDSEIGKGLTINGNPLQVRMTLQYYGSSEATRVAVSTFPEVVLGILNDYEIDFEKYHFESRQTRENDEGVEYEIILKDKI
jgi:hypothetical protein